MRLGPWLWALFILAGYGSAPPPKLAHADSGQRRIQVGSTFNCSELIRSVKPRYPKEAKIRRVQGTATLRAVVTKAGILRDFQVLKGDPLLIPAAIEAAKQWRYTPCLFNSEPIEIIVDLGLNFNLDK